MTSLSTLAHNFHGNTFGEMMAERRLAKGLSARGLSLAAGLSAAYVSKLEGGDYLPTVDKFARLADCLGMTDIEIVFLIRMLA